MNTLSILMLCCGLNSNSHIQKIDSVAYWKQQTREATIAAYEMRKTAEKAMAEMVSQKNWNLQLTKMNEELKVVIEDQKKVIEKCKGKD